jgi:hypothetical protein
MLLLAFCISTVVSTWKILVFRLVQSKFYSIWHLYLYFFYINKLLKAIRKVSNPSRPVWTEFQGVSQLRSQVTFPKAKSGIKICFNSV